MILVDTSVWINHFRRVDRSLRQLLEASRVACHPFVIGELACGTLRQRDEVLGALARLPAVPQASHDEVLWFVDHYGIAGRGVGWIDAHLLASSRLAAGTRLWSRDRRLQDIAAELRLAWSEQEQGRKI